MNQYGQQPPPNPYGQPPSQGYGPPPGWGHGQPPPQYANYGPPPGYGQPQYAQPQVDPRVAKLDSESTTWLIVGIAGFWIGMSWISGPLAWIMGARVRAGYARLGLPPSSNATAAWVIGIVSTILTVMSVVAILMLITLVGGLAIFGS